MATPTSDQPDSHYRPLHTGIPAWLGQASTTKRQALSRSKPQPFQANATQHAELKRLNGVHWNAQNAVDDALRHVQGPQAFARTVLEDALLTQFSLDLDSAAVYLRLYIPLNVPWLSIPSGAARTWTVSLLDAALHNFEHDETLATAFEPDSTFITRPSASGQFEPLPAVREKLSIAAFTRLCRELDIGARYQEYLREQLGLREPVTGAVLQHKVVASQKAALRAALHLARIRGEIQDDFAQQVEGLLEGRASLKLGDFALQCHDLQLMDAPLSGILLLAPDLERSRSVQRLVAYVPDDPVHPLKEYASPLAFKQELTRQLRAEDYQAFFSRFVSHEHRGAFFANLSQRLARITWHPPERGSTLAPWRTQPTDDPKLQFVATPVPGDIWTHLYQQKLNRILNDARTQAVSTAEVDRKARWARWDSFVNVASSVLNAALLIVAPFIPGLGELMLGYMAYQLLDEIFEGIVDWTEGLSQEAFGHVMSVLQSLVQLGAFAAGSTIGAAELRKVLPQAVLAFIDRFKPVTLANGAKRYWKPDLAPYRHDMPLPPRLGVDSLGLHRVRGEPVLPLEGQVYTVRSVADGERHVITHPARPEAYTPRLQHNGAGAWHTELDNPLQWDRPTLLRRLGHEVSELSAADRELALDISGVDDNALRKMHVRGEPVPPLLDDTLKRLRIDRSLHTLIQRLNSDDTAAHQQIDPQDLLQLLTTYGDWPRTRRLRILDAAGNTAWEFGDTDSPVVQIHEAQLNNGELLKTLLQTLSPEEIRTQFGERAADPQLSLDNRVKQLRKKLARLAEAHRGELFDSRYAQLQVTADAAAQQLGKSATGLPGNIVAHLLDHASANEWDELDHQRTPPRLADLARGALAELRINRAYEGLALAATPNLDSERLALNSLKIQPGWSPDLRLEARHLTAQGQLWLSVGPDDTPLLRSLVRTADGRYVPHDEQGPLSGETDLYTAILNALPDTQRDALGFGVNQGPALHQRLRQRPLPREELRQVLDTHVIHPPTQETLRLLGSDAGYPVQAAPAHTLEQRAQALYPALNTLQINDLLTHLHTQPGGAANGLAALAEEYQQLENDLAAWRRQAPALHPETGERLTADERRDERQNRRMIARELRRCWLREIDLDDYFDDPSVDGYSLRLDYPTLGALPQLSANFDHVSLLTLSTHAHTPGVLAFLERFQQLRHLTVKGANLGGVPDFVFNLPRLNSLSLSSCNIRLSPISVARIAALRRLQSLVLHDNPLGLTPSVAAIPNLIHLDLSHTLIEHLPDGLLSCLELQVALFNNNRIRTLPAELFELPPRRSDCFYFSHNPLSQATVAQIKAYYQRHGLTFGADAFHSDLRDARRLYPSLTIVELNQLIYDLPGTLEAGQVELARRAAELTTLQQQLMEWEQAPGTSPQEFARRIALRLLLERSWRQEMAAGTRQRHSLVIPASLAGELPLLSASFKHINGLTIQGKNAPIDVDGFLGCFPELLGLSLNHVVLGDIPSAVFSLPRLALLDLEGCALRLSTRSRTSLAHLALLKHLDLSDNPLGEPVDFSQLSHLSTLNLRATGLGAIPPGLLAQVPREHVNLSQNHIAHLPAELFALPAHVGRGFYLSANPLSREALEQVKRYCQRTEECFNIQAPTEQRDWARRLYPKMHEDEINRLIFGLPGGLDNTDNALSTLEADYQQLVADLQRWADDIPTEHPLVGGPLEDFLRVEEELRRRHVKRRFEEAWRRESPIDDESLDERTTHRVVLNTPIIGALPTLSTRMNHVTAFDLRGAFTLTEIDGTLKAFPALQTLIVSHCTLDAIPPAVFSLHNLTSLDLSHCEIRLTPATALAVGDLSTLEYLDLSNNPLGNAPDVSRLHQLSSLHLPNTQINALPAGVFQLSDLQTLDLSNNQLHDLPDDFLAMHQVFDDDSDFRGNPWSQESLRRMREYYLHTGVFFQIPQVTVNGTGVTLAPLPEEALEE
ncbi:hypothetical protein PSH87_21500 [Pseudomonas sp. FP453]|uniref:leucine-rich repeat domain-containing protein n=1 Tax=Pseudomonas sp. FP453 TaxID=2954094 RepID=UPI0027361B0D|nr:DUF6543 domain-containing protein [Pseudomonas sp. FP453]WLH89157.1 hypothetical protein PSH87_21500 [Pseudomonas sp. FP453]